MIKKYKFLAMSIVLIGRKSLMLSVAEVNNV